MIPEKLSMLKSFYNYLVDELILGFFKKNPVEKGSRYFLIIENEIHRNGLIDAMQSYAETITLSGIYQNNGSAITEEPYDTLLLRPQKGATGLIVGYDETSTEDYLTTIRNSVGVKGGKYEEESFVITSCRFHGCIHGSLRNRG